MNHRTWSLYKVVEKVDINDTFAPPHPPMPSALLLSDFQLRKTSSRCFWPLTTGNKNKKLTLIIQYFDTIRGFLHKLYAVTMDGEGREGNCLTTNCLPVSPTTENMCCMSFFLPSRLHHRTITYGRASITRTF